MRSRCCSGPGRPLGDTTVCVRSTSHFQGTFGSPSRRVRPVRGVAHSYSPGYSQLRRGILRSSPCLHGNAEALWQEYHGLGPKVCPAGLARSQQREKGVCIVSDAHETNHESHAHCGPGYASPEEAMKAEREKVLYTVALYVGTEVEQPDYLATVDVDPESPTYSRVVERLPMPNVGDELHHFGWNACSSCNDNESKSRRFLVVPGERSGRIHIIDTAEERSPKLHKVIEPEEIVEKTNLTAPHTVHCLPDRIMISMVGDGEGNGPGGFLVLDEDFNVAGRWDRGTDGMNFNYDSGTSRATTSWSAASGPPPTPITPASTPRTWPRVSTVGTYTSGTGRSTRSPRAWTSGRTAGSRWRSVSTTTPTALTALSAPP